MSQNHMVKIIQCISKAGYVETDRGKMAEYG